MPGGGVSEPCPCVVVLVSKQSGQKLVKYPGYLTNLGASKPVDEIPIELDLRPASTMRVLIRRGVARSSGMRKSLPALLVTVQPPCCVFPRFTGHARMLQHTVAPGQDVFNENPATESDSCNFWDRMVSPPPPRWTRNLLEQIRSGR